MSEPTRISRYVRPAQMDALARSVFEIATEAARIEYGPRLAAIEQDLALIRDEILPRAALPAAPCPDCKGMGQTIAQYDALALGIEKGQPMTCERCNGTGVSPEPQSLRA